MVVRVTPRIVGGDTRCFRGNYRGREVDCEYAAGVMSLTKVKYYFSQIDGLDDFVLSTNNIDKERSIIAPKVNHSE